MNNIEWKEGAACYADNYQWKPHIYGTLADVDGSGNLDAIEKAVNCEDFQLNEPRTGDYIEKSELDTEQKYNDAVDVFGLFGIYENEVGTGYFGLMAKWHCLEVCDSDLVNSNDFSGRKLTYNQLMAIGKLKRMMNEHEAGKSDIQKVIDKSREEFSGGKKGCFIIGESDEGLENAIPDSAKKNPNDNIEITFNPSVNLEQDFKKHIKYIESDIYNAVNKSTVKSAPKTASEVSADKKHKTAKRYLSECIEVQNQRGEQYDSAGTGERSFDAAAKAFNALTGKDLKGSDVCLLLTCVKAVRQYSNPNRLHEDSLLDGVSYLSLWAEELNKEIK